MRNGAGRAYSAGHHRRGIAATACWLDRGQQVLRPSAAVRIEQIVRVVGGNVSNTVRMSGDIQEYDLDNDGFLKHGQSIIALLKNRAAAVS